MSKKWKPVRVWSTFGLIMVLSAMFLMGSVGLIGCAFFRGAGESLGLYTPPPGTPPPPAEGISGLLYGLGGAVGGAALMWVKGKYGSPGKIGKTDV
jgi:hypothetical protein